MSVAVYGLEPKFVFSVMWNLPPPPLPQDNTWAVLLNCEIGREDGSLLNHYRNIFISQFFSRHFLPAIFSRHFSRGIFSRHFSLTIFLSLFFSRFSFSRLFFSPHFSLASSSLSIYYLTNFNHYFSLCFSFIIFILLFFLSQFFSRYFSLAFYL